MKKKRKICADCTDLSYRLPTGNFGGDHYRISVYLLPLTQRPVIDSLKLLRGHRLVCCGSRGPDPGAAVFGRHRYQY